MKIAACTGEQPSAVYLGAETLSGQNSPTALKSCYVSIVVKK